VYIKKKWKGERKNGTTLGYALSQSFNLIYYIKKDGNQIRKRGTQSDTQIEYV